MTTDWMTEAACIGVDPDAFYQQAKGRKPADWTEARKVCASCPVRAACLADAIETRDQHAFLGGLTPEERRPLLPKVPPSMRPPIRHGTVAGEKAHRRRGERPCTACKRACNIARRDREFRAAQEAS